MRSELFWDRDKKSISPEIEIERAINFGGFEYIKQVQKKYGIKKFKKILMNNRNLSRKAVNYWCLKLNMDRNLTKVFKSKNIWTPYR